MPINKRNIGTCIVLSIITFGIYTIYWQYLLVKNTRSIQKRALKCTGEMLLLIFVPFYNCYWWFSRGGIVRTKFSEYGFHAKGNKVLYLILSILGLDIVAMAIMQNDFNSLLTTADKPNEESDFVLAERSGDHTAIIMGILFVLFCIYSATLLLPLIWMFINSFKPNNNEFFYDQWRFTSFTLDNYKLLFVGENNILEMFLNTIILSLTIPTVSAFFSLCAGHAVGSFNYKLRGLVYFIFIMPMFVSVAGTTPYVYKLLNDLHLFDTHLGLIIMSCGVSGFGFLMYYSVFKNISHTYTEAAMIDGAGYWRIFLQILVPQAKNLIAAQWVMGFIGTWNDFSGPYLFLPSHPTLGVGVKEISDKIDLGHSYPELFANIILMLIPMLILYFVFQKKIMTVSLGGGIKG